MFYINYSFKKYEYDIFGKVLQYDSGQKLSVSNLPDSCEAHWVYDRLPADVKIDKRYFNNGICEVPDLAFLNAGLVKCFITRITDTASETIAEINMNVKARPKPDNYVVTDDVLRLKDVVNSQINENETIKNISDTIVMNGDGSKVLTDDGTYKDVTFETDVLSNYYTKTESDEKISEIIDRISVSKSEINENGELVVFYSNGTSDNLGLVVGADGKDGKDGTDGKNGENGKDGVGIDTVDIDAGGILSVKLTNGTNLTLGNVKGADGNGIAKSEINSDGELILTYTNGLSTNLGIAVGANGYTPVRGTDYWTTNDKTEIVNDVLSALPSWTGGSY